nr:hypothetical protein [Tanacetum cinerariifolium]
QPHPFLVVGGGCGGNRGVEMEKVMRWCQQWCGKMVRLSGMVEMAAGGDCGGVGDSGGEVTVEVVVVAWRWCKGRRRCGVDSGGGVRIQGSGGAWWRVIYGIG